MLDTENKSSIISERIHAAIDVEELYQSVKPLLEKYKPVHRSPAIGGWALQSHNGSYQEGWSSQFCPYNGPRNKSPTWTPANSTESSLISVQEFDQPTEISTEPFRRLLNKLEDMNLNPRRARIIQLLAGAASTWHQDGSRRFYQVRLHIPLQTNSGCYFETETGRYHMAADGGLYFVHINQPHRVANEGTTTRYHFVTHIWDQSGITQHHRYVANQNSGETIHPEISQIIS